MIFADFYMKKKQFSILITLPNQLHRANQKIKKEVVIIKCPY